MQKKSKDPYIACKSNNIYATGMKAPIAQYQRKLTEIVYKCSVTSRKFKPSQMPMDWYNQPQIQNYVQQGWEMSKEYVIQQPFKTPKYGADEELIEVFRLKRPYQKRGNIGAGFKTVAESVPAVAPQSFAPDNAKPITQEDLEKIDREMMNNEQEEELDDKIPF
tara:strand:- start:2129 stop:2620 length:492 start_codon:yes stop_codon:yes gene_type:complete